MPDPTNRDLERLLLKLSGEVSRVHIEIARVSAEAACIRLVDAKVDELIAAVDHTRDTVAALNQVTSGVRSLGESTHDIAIGLSRRMKNLVQRLVEKGLLAVEALSEDTNLRESDDATVAPLHAVEDPPGG